MHKQKETIQAHELWVMHALASTQPVHPGVVDFDDLPQAAKATYYGMAVGLARKLGLPKPDALEGASLILLDQAAKRVEQSATHEQAPELPDTPPRK